MKTQPKAKASRKRISEDKPRCGLCGKTKKVMRTECCGHWVCDDEDNRYVPFSYSRNSCARNHSRYTLCAFHYQEGHEGSWKDCMICRNEFETELYVYYGTNEYNFEKLENPPAYLPTKCSKCGGTISLGYDGYSQKENEYFCEACTYQEMKKVTSPTKH